MRFEFLCNRIKKKNKRNLTARAYIVTSAHGGYFGKQTSYVAS